MHLPGYFSWPHSTAYGNACTAKWIVERIQPNLANFNGEELNSDYVIQNGSSKSIGQLSTNAVRMWSCWPSGSGCTPPACVIQAQFTTAPYLWIGGKGTANISAISCGGGVITPR